MSARNKKKKLLRAIDTKVEGDEVSFLKYLKDCCENILESEPLLTKLQEQIPLLRNAPIMQLVKMRAEVTDRLERIYDVKYGKFAEGTHLLKRLV
jgi:hypothetical protein